MAQIINAMSREPIADTQTVIFLAGITSPPDAAWRLELIEELAHLRHVTIADPTRPDWDDTWVEDASFAPFADQVRWELDLQDRADVLVVNFGGLLDAASCEGRTGGGAAIGELPKAPISLLELGIRAGSGRRCMVVCRDGYWKKGNVQLVCERYGIKMFPSVHALAKALETELSKLIPGQKI